MKVIMSAIRAGWIMVILLALASCSISPGQRSRFSGEPLEGRRVVVLGFQAALFPCQGAKPLRDPLTGSVFMAEPVAGEKADELSERLYMLIHGQKDYLFVGPEEARGIVQSLEGTDIGTQEKPLTLLVKVGKAFKADMVLAGYLYRWREREGESYGVIRAASVAFSLHLISVKKATVLWSGRFDKTQRSLSENLLDMRTFFRGKGKWMSARELASLGLEIIIRDMPLRDK